MILGSGKCSSFGGPEDSGVAPKEGLGCIEMVDLAEWWFGRLFADPVNWIEGDGLGRNLNPKANYIAMRWAYGALEGAQGEILAGHSREQVRRGIFRLSNANGKSIFAQAADWGPDRATGRFVDCSPAILSDLNVQTNDILTVEFFPAEMNRV